MENGDKSEGTRTRIDLDTLTLFFFDYASDPSSAHDQTVRAVMCRYQYIQVPGRKWGTHCRMNSYREKLFSPRLMSS